VRILPSFLKGLARQGYRAQLDDAPEGIQLYSYLVQYLLETYAVDEVLTHAYMAVTGARLLEEETEKPLDIVFKSWRFEPAMSSARMT
jgi:hypothetical protein